MIARIKNFAAVDMTYEKLYVDSVEIKTNFEMSLILKATEWFKEYTIYELQEWGYDRMYKELINKLEEKGLA